MLINGQGGAIMYGWAKFVLFVLPTLIVLVSIAIYYISGNRR
ncbi:hypothetical protein PYCH_08460 [Pyrococcus yayanosii CH1]|uniref:Uncharacterized protein n=1 Tax=Pyrococcus yayanosii (strain CH1 / JCM 16557) TaxID=529709 RepID=F8AJ90_PYRYC|nr:hypothetical protein PYCH_08460 [Pyrococcus yayanosii CH1]